MYNFVIDNKCHEDIKLNNELNVDAVTAPQHNQFHKNIENWV